MGERRYFLEQGGLLQFFEQVFGMVGQCYGESGFGSARPEPSPLEGGAEGELREPNANLSRSVMDREGLSPAEIRSERGV